MCLYAEPAKEIISRYKGIKVKINSRIDCESKNVVYRVRCNKCGKEYIGETGRTVKERIQEHIGYINGNKNQPTGVHFNRRGHDICDFRWTAFEKFTNPNPYYRKAKEEFRINQFDVLEPKGMNKQGPGNI